ncbi:MAG TPA: class I SAM-dependent methyltransferase, partial [Bryobacteraceae bacterium]|nr:class I SAM-dependent methyltransferase [Bryobacteraceae bacterium]
RILGLIQPELNARLEKLHTLENLLKDVEAAGLDQHRELNNLRAQVQLRNRKTAASTDNELPLDSQWFDSFYLRFENTFRGTREDIRQRFSIYLPILRDSASVTQSAPLLDVGCGRGEWLELLQSEQVAAQGVDSNTAMIKECRQFGLPVVHADALTYLRTLPSNSFGALTCFHLLEHLAFPSLLRLLREFERVLQPNGLLILETPNISNARVALEEFYVDPTHRRPLPSRLLEFLVSSFEFREARVVPLHPTRHRIVPDENSMLAVWLRNQFEGPEDYAIVASRK